MGSGLYQYLSGSTVISHFLPRPQANLLASTNPGQLNSWPAELDVLFDFLFLQSHPSFETCLSPSLNLQTAVTRREAEVCTD